MGKGFFLPCLRPNHWQASLLPALSAASFDFLMSMTHPGFLISPNNENSQLGSIWFYIWCVRGQQTFSAKSQLVNILGFEGLGSSVATSQFWYFSMKAATENSKWMGMAASKEKFVCKAGRRLGLFWKLCSLSNPDQHECWNPVGVLSYELVIQCYFFLKKT